MREGELTGLDSAALTERLKQQLSSVGGLALDGERELARELVRRARREEQLRNLLVELLVAGDALASQPGPEWHGLRVTARLNYCQMLVLVKGAALPFSWSRLGYKEVTHGHTRSLHLPPLPPPA